MGPMGHGYQGAQRHHVIDVQFHGGKKAKFVLPMPSFALTHPLLTPEAIFANAQDLFLFNSYISSHSRFKDHRYQAYCMKKFQKFLELQAEHPNVPLVPTACIDMVLQSYMIRPKICQCIPTLSSIPPRTTGFAVADKETLATTAKLWAAKYGEEYDDLLTLPDDMVLDTQDEFLSSLASDIAMYQDFGVKETDFFAITNTQYAQCISPHLQKNAGVVSMVVAYAQDRTPGEALCSAYQRFLKWIVFLHRTHEISSPNIVPTGLVDYVWHAHMLQHVPYCAFSSDLLGNLLVHVPAIPDDTGDKFIEIL